MSMYGSFVYLFVCLFTLILYFGNSLTRPVVKLLELGNNSGFNLPVGRHGLNLAMDHNCFLLSLYYVFKHNLIVLIWTFQTLVIEKFLPGKKEKIKLVITLRQKQCIKIKTVVIYLTNTNSVNLQGFCNSEHHL